MRHSVAIALLAALTSMAWLPQVSAQGTSGDLPPHSMKGYELYSWEADGAWQFALVVGTDRLKSYAEVSAPERRMDDLATLKQKLDGLHRGEQISWIVTRVPGVSLAPRDIVRDVRRYCNARGLILEVEPSPQ